MKKTPFHQSGFSLIEMIVSLAVFSIVITVAVGALLMLVATNQQLQGEQSVMTNLSFTLDSMTREIRTGTHYYCDSQGSINGNNNIFNPSNNMDTILGLSNSDCPNGSTGARFQGLAFIEGGDSITQSDDRILYYFDRNTKEIYRRVGGQAPESIVSSGIVIKKLEFFVTGSKPLRANGANTQDQSSVTIFIEAAEKDDVTSKSYYVQTTVTQRILDI